MAMRAPLGLSTFPATSMARWRRSLVATLAPMNPTQIIKNRASLVAQNQPRLIESDQRSMATMNTSMVIMRRAATRKIFSATSITRSTTR